jgi:amino acid adenylation domain-containing protein
MISADHDLFFWLNKLARISLPSADEFPARNNGGEFYILIPEHESSLIKKLAKDKPENIFKLLIAASAIVADGNTHNEPILINSPSLFPDNGDDGSPGKIFLQVAVNSNEPVRLLLAGLHKELQMVSGRTNYSPAKLQAELEKKGILPEQFLRIQVAVKGFTSVIPDDTKSSLNIELDENNNCFILRLNSPNVYEPQRLAIVGQRLKNVLIKIAENLDFVVEDLQAASPDEISHVLRHAKGKDATDTGTIITLFDKIVNSFPARPAMVFGSTIYTYCKLNDESDKLAFYLLHVCNFVPGTVVALIADYNQHLCTTLMGILKAGCIYLPIDPQVPEDRLDFILTDSNCKALIVAGDQKHNYNKLPVITPYQWSGCCSFFIKPVINTESPAYIIYTSGTTGTPKGVIISHGSLYNYVRWLQLDHRFSEQDRSVLLASPAFDLGYTSLWGMLLSGGCIDVVPSVYFTDPEWLMNYIVINGISILKLTPSLFHIFILAINPDFAINISLRKIFLGGEPLISSDIKLFHSMFSDVEFVNHYGPTEATVGVISCVIDADRLTRTRYPVIGRPIRGSSVYILNTDNEIQPFFTAGEICVGGNGLASGYLNNKLLSDKKFTAHPVIPEERIYHTGDQGRMLADGSIQFLGRYDSQVKINGYRVDLKEIDHVLLKFKGITGAHTILIKDENTAATTLVSFYQEERPVKQAEIREKLSCVLPSYMLPGMFIPVTDFPITANGKLDEIRLLDMYKNNPAQKIQPADNILNNVQQRLLYIWQKKLNKQVPSINHNFFELGGHSLLAVALFFEINKEFGTRFKLADIFLFPTIEQQEKQIIATRGNEEHVLQHAPIALDYPLSSGQLEIWSLCQLGEAAVSYNVPRTYHLKGPVDPILFNRALQGLLNKHESLRTVFRQDTRGIPVQVILPFSEMDIPFFYEDISDLTDAESDQKVLSYAGYVFNLEKGPLTRVWLLKTGVEKYILLLLQHHIITDGWSANILLNDLFSNFSRLLEGLELSTGTKQLQYKDYCCWQQRSLEKGSMKDAEEYWKNKFLIPPAIINLPVNKKNQYITSHTGDSVSVDISTVTKQRIQQIAVEKGTTDFIVFYAALNVFLYKSAGIDDITLGVPVSGRDHTDLQYITGYFVNILPLRIKMQPGTDFLTLVDYVKNEFTAAFRHQAYPYYNITGGQWKPAIFADKVISGKEINNLPGNFELIPERNAAVFSKNELRIIVFEDNTISFEFNDSVYDADSIRLLVNMFSALLSWIAENPRLPCISYPLCTSNDIYRLTKTYNTVVKPVIAPNHGVIHYLLESSYRYSNKHAIEHNSVPMSYDSLFKSAGALTNYLQDAYGFRKGDVVGLQLPRSAVQVISILAVMMGGGVVLPIDYNHPADYSNKLLNRASTSILLTTEDKKRNSCFDKNRICTQLLFNPGAHVSMPMINVTSADPAYIIYTSGSTGEPKGVEILNESFLNYVEWASDFYFKSESTLRVAYFTSLAFDLTLTSIFCTLLKGHTIVVFDETDNLPNLLCDVFDEKKQIDLVKMTPSHVTVLGHTGVQSSCVTRCILGGENVYPYQLHTLRSLNKFICIYNEYGPTEATVGCTAATLDTDVVTIGRPIRNASIYILDNGLCPVPENCWGELYIGGKCLSTGYLKNAVVTAERFINDPFNYSAKMYRSGDIARWLPGGILELKGRSDDQIKSRGFRIEPAEIEQNILQYGPVSSACVLGYERGGVKEIIAFLTTTEQCSVDQIKEFMSEKVPVYMIPTQFIFIDQLPLTVNGKTDRGKLLLSIPAPIVEENPKSNDSGKASLLEERLLHICRELLNSPQLNLQSNFFSSGGHSLSAIQLLVRIHREFGIKINLNVIFSYPVLIDLAAKIEKGQRMEYEAIPVVPQADFYLASHSQKRAWLLSQVPESSRSHHIQEVLLLNQQVKTEYISKAFRLLLLKHEILRTGFLLREGDLFQKIFEPQEIEISYNVVQCKNDESEIEQLVTKEREKLFDLSQPPLLRYSLIEAGEKILLCITIHHIIADQWTGKIIIRDIDWFCGQFLKDHNPLVLTKALPQYKDYAAWHHKKINEGNRGNFISFWKKRIYLPLPQTGLPADFPELLVKSYSGKRYFFSLSENESADLYAAAEQLQETVFTILLSAFYLSLFQISTGSDFIVGIPLAGRVHPDTEEMAGLFLNALPCRIRISERERVDQFITTVGTEIRAISEQQLYPIDMLMEDLSVPRPTNGKSPLFEHVFNWANANPDTISESSLLSQGFVQSISNTSKHDLMISGIERDRKVYFTAEYADSVYHEKTVINFCHTFLDILLKLFNTDKSRTVTQLLGRDETNIPDYF